MVTGASPAAVSLCLSVFVCSVARWAKFLLKSCDSCLANTGRISSATCLNSNSSYESQEANLAVVGRGRYEDLFVCLTLNFREKSWIIKPSGKEPGSNYCSCWRGGVHRQGPDGLFHTSSEGVHCLTGASGNNLNLPMTPSYIQ